MGPETDRPFWWDTATPPASDDAPLPSAVDVAIVGGGYTGLSAARALARRGARLIVLEREQPGWGASSRNGGQVLTGLRIDPARLLARFGRQRARALFDSSLDAIADLERVIADERIACGFERVGHVQAAVKPAHFDQFGDEQQLLDRTFNHPVRLVPRAQQRTELGTDAYFGLLVDPASAAVNPAQLVYGLARAAARAGASIAGGAAVVALRRSGARWRVVTTRGMVSARDVLLATDAYTGSAAPALRRRLIPVGSYVIATEPLDEAVAARLVPQRRMAFDSRHFLHYFRLTDDRRLLFGGRARFSTPTPSATRKAASVLASDMTAIFPELAGARIAYAWSGRVAFTMDEMPHAGRLEGAYYAAGYGGHGIAMAAWLGALVARRIAGELTEHPFFDDALKPVPLYNGTPWFLPLVGAYYRLKDLVE